MTYLYIVLGVALWFTVGWFVTLGLALVDDGVRVEMHDDDFTTFMFVMLWPLALIVVALARLVRFMDPAGRAYEIIDRMDQRREAKRNRGSVIVKSRRFRGKED